MMDDMVLNITLSILGGVSLIMAILGIVFYRNEKNIKTNTSMLTQGEVIRYSVNNSRAPVVRYTVDGRDYEKSLRYTYVTTVSGPGGPVKTVSKKSLMDTKLRLSQNSRMRVNTVMQDAFPIGSSMKVYYNPDKPKQAFVERFAPMYMGQFFMFGAGVLMLAGMLLSYLLK